VTRDEITRKALDELAEIDRELGLDYTHPPTYVIDKSAAKRIATQLGWAPKREWQGLTEEEMHECWDSPLTPLGMRHARAIEAKLKEKNT
jgi:hypothetical protein